MANNLFISYDLIAEGQNYAKVAAAIQSLGNAVRVHKSFWYVNSPLNSDQAIERLKPAIDSNDKIFVVDATNHNAHWNNGSLDESVANHIKGQWHV